MESGQEPAVLVSASVFSLLKIFWVLSCRSYKIGDIGLPRDVVGKMRELGWPAWK